MFTRGCEPRGEAQEPGLHDIPAGRCIRGVHPQVQGAVWRPAPRPAAERCGYEESVPSPEPREARWDTGTVANHVHGTGVADPEHDSLTTVNKHCLSRTFAINTFGPLLLTQALLPNVLRSPHPRLGYVSSRVGSIADNGSGGNYAYRSSKTALNMVCKNLSVELRAEGVVVVIMHPGIVRTGLIPGTGDVPGAVDPDEAASKLYRILVSRGIEDTGKFWHREGEELPW